MKKIRILQFPIANSYGGITHYALDNWYKMDKSKFECDFATMSPQIDFSEEIEKTGAKIFYLSCYPSKDKELFKKEFNAILDNGYDVVHLHTKQWKDFTVEEICKERGIKKVIVHSHSTRCDNNDDEERRKETDIHNRVKAEFTEDLATDFWACSQMAADWLFGPQISRDKIKIMHNAIEIEKFLFNPDIRRKKRRELGFNDDDFIIGNVGRLCYQKNQELLVNAFAKAFEVNENVKLVLVGEGPHLNTLKNLVSKLDIEDRVLFLGKRYDVNELYQAFDLFALTSRFEGLPITLIEAQCSGLLCLVNSTITKESEISEKIRWVENCKEEWINSLQKYSYVQERNNMTEQMRKSGYDINEQVSIVSLNYESEYEI